MNEPTIIYYDNHKPYSMEYRVKGSLHREDGPALTEWYENGKLQSEIYYINGLKHREDGPATQRWHGNGKKWVVEYFLNNKLHREDGPATQEWDIYGNLLYRGYYIKGICIDHEWFTQIGKDITKDFSNEMVRNMIFNIYGVNQ